MYMLGEVWGGGGDRMRRVGGPQRDITTRCGVICQARPTCWPRAREAKANGAARTKASMLQAPREREGKRE